MEVASHVMKTRRPHGAVTMTENYSATVVGVKRRRKLAQIRAYCRQLAQDFRPRIIILFGSYAYGKPTRESDVDLLVIMPHRSGPVRQSVAIRQRCAAPFPLDLLVWTPAYARKRQDWNDSFTREVFEQGRIMYEARNAWLGQES